MIGTGFVTLDCTLSGCTTLTTSLRIAGVRATLLNEKLLNCPQVDEKFLIFSVFEVSFFFVNLPNLIISQVPLRPGSRIQRRVEYEALPKLKRLPIELLEMIAIRAIENGRRRLLLATAGRIIDKCDAIADECAAIKK